MLISRPARALGSTRTNLDSPRLALPSNLHMQFDDVSVVKLVIALHRLPLEHTGPPDPGEFQCVLEIAMDFPGQVEHRTADWHCEWFRPIGRLARDFREDSQNSK